MDWKEFWDTFPAGFDDKCFYRQVGKTFQGEPISQWQFDLLVRDVQSKIDLKPDDSVLDLCCGNGLITRQIAAKCKTVMAIDFSEALISIAQKYQSAPNIRYCCKSALDIGPEDLINGEPFTKIYMYEALQHFQPEDLAPLISRIGSVCTGSTIILLASVTDADRLTMFYDTPEHLEEYYRKKVRGDLMLGTWWDKSFIRDECEQQNFDCAFYDQPSGLHTAHYRFDVCMVKKPAPVLSEPV
jgi:cyclopropane fatty-acyl-phospholipid synthase-like methyltransferase